MPQQTPASATADPGERERGSRHMVPSVSKRDLCRRYCPVPAVAVFFVFFSGFLCLCSSLVVFLRDLMIFCSTILWVGLFSFLYLL